MSILRSVSCAALMLSGMSAAASAQSEVNLYATREPGLIKPLLEEFTKTTGIKVNTVFLSQGMAERVAAEGEKSPADVLMTVDVGNLVDLVDRGITQPVKSDVLEEAVPPHMRAANRHWYALSARGRVAYVSKDRVRLDAITYEDLADPKWKGKICIRSGQHPYNTALAAAYLARHGEAATEQWMTGLKANLARKPAGGDREVARDILGGQCDIGLANSYYVGLMRSGKGGPEQQKWGEAINVILPTFKDGGTHVNISGAAIAKHAPNTANAVKLLEYLVSDAAQSIYARGDFEYPIKSGVPSDPIIDKLGKLNPDRTPLEEVAKARKAASRLFEKVGFDN